LQPRWQPPHNSYETATLPDLVRLKPYKIHPDAEVTVVLFRKWKVRGNLAFKSGELQEKDVQAIVTALVKIIPTKEELEQEAKAKPEAEQKRKLDAAKFAFRTF
jgi:hypothetical protein